MSSTGEPKKSIFGSGGCELCEAAKMTRWYHEDDLCWIADCEICEVPMVVWKAHDPAPDEPTKALLHERLAVVVEEHFVDFDHYVDDNMRQIPDHYHAHARPRGGYFGRNLVRRTPG